jgi:two-component system, cell cycle sensor histidine kinase and response regulator CckA
MDRKPSYEELEQRINELEKESGKRKRAEDALREREELFRAIFNNAGVGIGIADKNKTFTLVNDRMAQMLDASQDELIGASNLDITHPEDIELSRNRLDSLFLGEVDAYRVEKRYRRKDGSDLWVDLSVSDIRDKDGNTQASIGMFTDITDKKQAEKFLQAVSSRHKALLEAIPDIIIEVDANKIYTWANRSGFDFFGEDVIGKEAAYYFEGEQSRTYEAVRPLFDGDENVIYVESWQRRKDGEKRLLAWWCRVLKDAQGNVTGALSSARDITEYKQTEVRLRNSEEKYRELFDEAPIGYLEYDNEGRIVSINQRGLEMFGYTAQDMIGEYVWKFNLEEDFARRQILEKLSGTRGPGRSLERTYRRKDSTTIPVLIEDRVIKDEQGRITGIRSALQDITERKRAEQALQESEKNYRDLYDEAPIGYHEYDTEGRITRVNRRELEMLGYRAEEMVGRPVWDFLVEKTEARESIRARLAGLEPPRKGFTRTYVRKDGITLSMLIDSTVVKNSEGQITGIRAALLDVTERRRADAEKEKLQAQLIQAQKMESVGRLAGGVAHDFNNKLGIIIGNVELAMMGVDPSGPVHQELQEIQKAAQRSADLVRQLLAFARKQTVSPKVLDLNDTVAGMLKMLHRLIGEDIGLAWMPGHDLWPIRIDPSQVDQILANLAVNAKDAVAGVGKVTIETNNIVLDEVYCADHAGFVPGEYVLLSVSDNGIGMSKAVLEHLFEPFFTTKEVGKGTGLGLSTIYGIVKQNRGFVNVYSEPGKGTTLKVYLPRFESESVEGQQESKPETPRGGAETVLIVEDEAAILNIGKAMAKRLGYNVLTASTPGEALRLAGVHNDAVDLVLTDVVMPDMNGRELVEQLRAIHPGLKCVYMSGYTANVIAHHGVLDDGVSFIQKPFSMKDLAIKLREVLDKS